MPDPMTVLVTGGAGFIGSHTCVELLRHGHEVVAVDDYSACSPAALTHVEKLAGRPLAAVYELDLRDRHALSAAFRDHPIAAVVHFAAKKAVGESMRLPLEYYDTNVGGTTNLLRVMGEHGVYRMVFSSSGSVYGDTRKARLTEGDPPRPTNPYSASKWMCEQVLADVCVRLPGFTVLALRYFNPTGAHPSGMLGEDPRGMPANLMPYLMRIAVGRLDRLRVFGGDYPTPDGTAVRDYIHVMDVADGHRVALERLDDQPGMRVLNLGTGVGTSVLDLVEAFGAACGMRIPYEIVGRRHGDVPQTVADPSAVAREWGWCTSRDLAAMCEDAWRFQRLNPTGYAV